MPYIYVSFLNFVILSLRFENKREVYSYSIIGNEKCLILCKNKKCTYDFTHNFSLCFVNY
jgi:hypothetical protein